jgi:CO/xanthine dehydrogenase Mo-binding subunit
MSAMPQGQVSRRDFLAACAGLVVGFSVAGRTWAQAVEGAASLPGSLKQTPFIDSWIRIAPDGAITVFTGKAELGQGIKTALIQVAAEELVVRPTRIALVTADTARTPNEGYTAGSQSMSNSATAVMNAAAQARDIIADLAAAKFGVAVESLNLADGIVRAGDGRSATYGELVAEQSLHVTAKPTSRLRDPKTRSVIGKPLPRVDIPAKVTGGVAYVHDLRLPGMLHARVLRPPTYRASVRSLDATRVEKMPGVVKVVRNGSFVAVVAEREYQSVRALEELGRATTWDAQPLGSAEDLYGQLVNLPHDDYVIRDSPSGASAWTLEASYRRPYQMHGAIGPSCAVAQFQDGSVTVWTHSQGVYPLRAALAEMLRMPPERVRCIHMEGSGCYGHNAADDAAADAALIAVALPGRPVRVQWMREQEHAFEPYGSAMLSTVRAALSANGSITDWQYEVWSGTHAARPGGAAGNLLPAWYLQEPFTLPVPQPIPQPEGGGDRNSIPLYSIPGLRVVHHFVPQMPLRVSALRSLGAYANVFAIESFMDELALKANVDPVAFRMRHLRDSRAQDVLRLAADQFHWDQYTARPGRGRGIAFARYKNLGAYAAVALEVKVDRESGRLDVLRAVCAVDSGDAVNLDGIRNQMEGGIIQSLSWTMYESVAYGRERITSRDWNGYPILRFAGVPRTVEVHVVERPGTPFLGTGEAAQGPTAAALANALAHATGARIRELPITRQRVADALAG